MNSSQFRGLFLRLEVKNMAFFVTAISLLSNIVVLLGAALGTWGVINLLEGYGNDNPGAKSQGIKQVVAGAGVAIIGLYLIPELATMFEAEAAAAVIPHTPYQIVATYEPEEVEVMYELVYPQLPMQASI